MADILRTGQQVGSGFENQSIKSNAVTPPGLRGENVPNPARVMSPDGKTEREDRRFELLSNSNYETFIRDLKDGQELTDAMTAVLFADLETMAATGQELELLGQMEGFMDLITMGEKELMVFIQNQISQASEFGEPFFRVIKEVFDQTSQLQLKTAILRAVGKYADLASSNHTIKSILIECRAILPHLFTEDRSVLEKLMERLTVLEKPYPEGGDELFSFLKENFQSNRQILLKELIPFFSSYIRKTHDMGLPRERMFLITDQVARYINGSPEEVQELFVRLLAFGDMAGRFRNASTDRLMMILGGFLRKKLEEDNHFTKEFCSLMETGLKSGSKEQFAGIINAMLKNESVYLPLLHLMVPARFEGGTMFSELWIDPDSEGSGDGKRSIQMLMKLDVKNLGTVELIIGYRDRQVDMHVFYPSSLKGREKMISSAVSAIAVQNGMTPRNLQMEERKRPLRLPDVFPKIKRRKDAVNVRV